MRSITIFISILMLFTIAGRGQRQTAFIAKIKETPTLMIPEEAKRSGIGGDIYIWVNLDADGNVVTIESVAGPSPVCRSVTRADVVALREAAVEAAKSAKFEPILDNGRPQRASGVVHFEVPAGVQAKSDDQIVHRGLLSEPGPNGSENFLKSNVLSLPKPVFPPAARMVKASGPVSVKILIDQSGDVFSAEAITGHPLLRASASQAACQAKFRPSIVAGRAVKITGVVTYNFVP